MFAVITLLGYYMFTMITFGVDVNRIAKRADLNPLIIPAKYYEVDDIPKPGSGKVDLVTSKKWAIKLESEE